MTHIYVSKLTIIGSDNGLSPCLRQAIIWTNAGTLLIGPWGTNFGEILIGTRAFSFKKLHLKTSSAKWRLFCLGLNELTLVMLDFFGNFYYMYFSTLSFHSYLKSFLMEDKDLFVNAIDADTLGMQGAKISVAIILSPFTQTSFPVLALEGLILCTVALFRKG